MRQPIMDVRNHDGIVAIDSKVGIVVFESDCDCSVNIGVVSFGFVMVGVFLRVEVCHQDYHTVVFDYV